MYAYHLWPPELRGGSGWKIIKRNTSFVLAIFFAKFAANSHHCKSFMAGNYQETNCKQEFMANFCKILFIKAFLSRKIGLKEILSETGNHLEYINNRITYCNKDMPQQEIMMLKRHLPYTYLFIFGKEEYP